MAVEGWVGNLLNAFPACAVEAKHKVESATQAIIVFFKREGHFEFLSEVGKMEMAETIM